jgi:hypothetical protein
MQLSALKAKTVWPLSVVPFVCALPNIVILNSSSKRNQIVGYEYVNEKARKECWIMYEDGDLLRNLEYWPELYIKDSVLRICAITDRSI